MTQGRVTVETYPSELEAQIDLGRLQSAGVGAVVVKDDCGGMRPHLAYTLGVKLMVASEDLEKAREVLSEGGAEVSEPWTCACGEAIEAGFDACWKCGAGRPATG